MKFIFRTALLVGTLSCATLALASSFSIKITETPNGSYTSSLIHNMEPAKNETVGTYQTKKEARKAARAAKKAKDSVISSECGNVGQPPCT